MKAIVQDSYGPADVLELRDVESPRIGDDEVLVRVHAASVDRAVAHLMSGKPYLVRLMGFGLRRPKAPTPGTGLAGRVETAGKDVTQFRPGDEVYGTGDGAFAEYARAKADKLAPKPASVTFEQAAAVPHGGFTALQALRDQGKVQEGQSVLIVGASGAVGTAAVQLAKAFGATVTGVCSTVKVDLVRSLGADHVLDYTRDDFADGTNRYDVILDVGGNSQLSRLRRALTPTGTLVIVGGEGGGQWIGMGRQFRAITLSPLVGQKLRVFVAKERADDLRTLSELLEDGVLTPVVDRTYPLVEAGDAIRRLEAGDARGTIVLTV